MGRAITNSFLEVSYQLWRVPQDNDGLPAMVSSAWFAGSGFAGCHRIGLWRRLPAFRGRHALLAGSQAHSTRLLPFHTQQIGFLGFRSCGAAAYQTDLVTASFCFLEVQCPCRSIHFQLQLM
ncbi:hypothetical protein IP68_02395 [Blastomonas sp. AAP25]|nr:hypothetical protein IP68_02395 [Blastomonas sp. AAP25]